MVAIQIAEAVAIVKLEPNGPIQDTQDNPSSGTHREGSSDRIASPWAGGGCFVCGKLPEWNGWGSTEGTARLRPERDRWACLGSREDRAGVWTVRAEVTWACGWKSVDSTPGTAGVKQLESDWLSRPSGKTALAAV